MTGAVRGSFLAVRIARRQLAIGIGQEVRMNTTRREERAARSPYQAALRRQVVPAEAWTAVRVRRMIVDRDNPMIPEGHSRLRVEVHLGELAPADVRVYLKRVDALADVRRAEPVQLWSTQAYGNGAYVFEGHIHAGDLKHPERLEVEVEAEANGTHHEPVRQAVGPVLHGAC